HASADQHTSRQLVVAAAAVFLLGWFDYRLPGSWSVIGLWVHEVEPPTEVGPQEAVLPGRTRRHVSEHLERADHVPAGVGPVGRPGTAEHGADAGRIARVEDRHVADQSGRVARERGVVATVGGARLGRRGAPDVTAR